MRINEKDYYDWMQHFDRVQNFDTVLERWHACFGYILRNMKVGYSQRIIDDLFWNFEMSNWEDLHLCNTEYDEKTKEELKESFASECCYICDRASYDRLFRTNWLFKQAFEKELDDRWMNS